VIRKAVTEDRYLRLSGEFTGKINDVRHGVVRQDAAEAGKPFGQLISVGAVCWPTCCTASAEGLMRSRLWRL
jgi:hypothetical protein